MNSVLLILLYYLLVGFVIFRIALVVLRRIKDKKAEDFEQRDN